MTLPKLIIAIDGYSSTGKSSFAKLIAARLGYTHLDSGALYRSVTLHALDAGMVSEDGSIDLPRLKESLDSLEIEFRNAGDGISHAFVNGKDVEPEIRSLRVSSFVSKIAEVAFVRDFVDGILHRYCKGRNIVMDGRDIGTTVCPDADIKIFMTATPEVRARRRLKEMIEAGKEATLEDVMNNIRERDHIDSHRKASPLSRASDAITLDNSMMTMEEEVEWLLGLLEEKYGRIWE